MTNMTVRVPGFHVLAYAPAGLFLGVGAVMNMQFASTLGTDEWTTRCWLALSAGATLFTAFGPGLVHRAWRTGETARAIAAALILSLSLSYDALAAYGFARSQHAATEARAGEATRVRKAAESDVSLAESALQTYADAPAAAVAEAQAATIDVQIQAIDRTAGVLVAGQPCGGPPDGKVSKELCPRRAELAAQLKVAHVQLARAQAKERSVLELSDARRRLAALPEPPTGDARSELLPVWIVEWLPVLLLTAGAMLGFFAVSPTEPSSPSLGRASTAALPSGSPAPPEPHSPVLEPAKRRRRAAPGAAKLAQRIAELAAESPERLPAGISVDDNGWLRGNQRTLAIAAGYRSVSTFSRELHAAALSGGIELSTTDGTAVRPTKAPLQ